MRREQQKRVGISEQSQIQTYRTLFPAVAILVLATPAIAQTSLPEPAALTGSISAGLALTGGNTDTSNFNLAIGLSRNINAQNVIKATGFYLRGDRDDVLTVDRTSANIRDEYTVSNRTFLFSQMDNSETSSRTWHRLKVETDEAIFVGDGGANERSGATEAGLVAYWCTWFLDRWPERIRPNGFPGDGRFRAARRLRPRIVEAKTSGTCTVRVVHSLFASTDDFDGQLEGTETG